MKKLFFVLMALVLLSSCSKPPVPNNGSNGNPVPLTARGVGFMPSSDFLQSLKDADSSGSYIGFYAPFDKNKDIPEIVAVAYEYKLDSEPIVNVNFFDASTGKTLPGYSKEIYKKQVVSIAARYKPKYLGVGNEINLYSDGMDKAAEIYNEVYDEIKKSSPETKVFAVFQYEHLDDVSAINKFNMDVVGITSYPFIKGYKSPSDIPKDYYSKLSSVNKPIIFTEIGHNSLASEDDQANFIDVFYSRLSEYNIKPEIVIWGLLYDYPQKGGIWNAGLFTKDGSSKKVFYKWTFKE